MVKQPHQSKGHGINVPNSRGGISCLFVSFFLTFETEDDFSGFGLIRT